MHNVQSTHKFLLPTTFSLDRDILAYVKLVNLKKILQIDDFDINQIHLYFNSLIFYDDKCNCFHSIAVECMTYNWSIICTLVHIINS